MLNQIKRAFGLLAFLLCLFQNVEINAGGFMLVGPEGFEWNRGQQPRMINPVPRRPAPVRSFPLEVKSEAVKVKLDERSASTSIDQVFYNSSNRQLEGYFLFPLPKGAVIDKFTMFINGKETEAELLDAAKAKKIYEDIVRSMRDPALLEYSEQGLLKARVFPILPRSEQRIKISYTELLPIEDGTIQFQYPLDLDKSSNRTIPNFSLDIEMCANSDIKTIYCPTHDPEIIRKSDREARIGMEKIQHTGTSDFKLYYTLDNRDVGLSVLQHRPSGDDGFFVLTINPSVEIKEEEIAAKDISFVLDVSGSMAGEKLEKAKEALSFCVNNLNSKDRFNIIRFSTEARSMFDKPENADKENVLKAREFIKGLKAIGGTNIEEALEIALEAPTSKDRPHFVVFITDGKPTIGTTEQEALLKQIDGWNNGQTRIFTFGIGEDINTHLLDKITAETKAYRSYILPSEDIELSISNFYTKISSPVLTDIQLDFDRSITVSDIYPKVLPDLFRGSSLTVFGRYNGEGNATINLSGMLNGKKEQFSYSHQFLKQKAENEFIPPLWATRYVGYLLDQIRLNGSSQELVDDVVRIAKEFGIVTPYTSYLIIEDEAVTNRPTPRPNMPGPPRPQWSGGAKNSPRAFDSMAESEIREEFEGVKAKSGKRSIQSSREIQNLNLASNYKDVMESQERIHGDNAANMGNLKNINGRAIYQQGDNSWIDVKVYEAQANNSSVKRIAFNSDDYFTLLNDEPEVLPFLALGNNVQFVYNNILYQVFDD